MLMVNRLSRARMDFFFSFLDWSWNEIWLFTNNFFSLLISLHLSYRAFWVPLSHFVFVFAFDWCSLFIVHQKSLLFLLFSFVYFNHFHFYCFGWIRCLILKFMIQNLIQFGPVLFQKKNLFVKNEMILSASAFVFLSNNLVKIKLALWRTFKLIAVNCSLESFHLSFQWPMRSIKVI